MKYKMIEGTRDCVLYLRDKIYPQYQENIIDSLENVFKVASIEASNSNTIMMKIKTSNLRRRKDYTHSSMFYYPMVAEAMRQFFYEKKEDIIGQIINDPDAEDIEQALVNIVETSQVDTQNIAMLLNVTTLSDDIIIVGL